MSNVVFGVHAVKTLVERDPKRVQQVYLIKGRDMRTLKGFIATLESSSIPIKWVSRQWLDEYVSGAVHQGVVAQTHAGAKPQYHESDLPNLLNKVACPFLLVLDGVTDPHNLGACLRSADAAGVDAVIIPKDRSASLNATVRKVACGAAETIPLIAVTNLSRTLRLLRERHLWIIGMAGEAPQDLYNIGMNGPLAFVMGAEGEGLRRLTREHCDELVRIPMAGSMSSLNVSVATGVCLFEAVRQRRTPKTSSS